ncbi:MAG: hypothetical protein VX574_08280 [Myxococcota bacterium]|nr:hypothetical protein [Myxococcota bacterium]
MQANALRGRSLGRVGLFAWALVLGGVAYAQSAAPGAAPIRFDVTVSQISEKPGPIDPRAAELDERLRREFRYESLRVLEERRMELGIDDVGRVDLPNGKRLQLKPLLRDAKGVLLSVDLQGTMRGDLRVKNGHVVVIGAQRFGDGKLVISLVPRF